MNSKPRATTRLLRALEEYRGGRGAAADTVVKAGAALRLIEEASAELRADRQQAVADLRAAGYKWAEIGDLTGLGRARLNQILHGINGGNQGRRRPA